MISIRVSWPTEAFSPSSPPTTLHHAYQGKKYFILSPLSIYSRANNAVHMVGTNTEESNRRKNTWIKYGCNSFEKGKEVSRPLSFWTEQDILQFLRDFNIPYCQGVYGDMLAIAPRCKRGTPETPLVRIQPATPI